MSIEVIETSRFYQHQIEIFLKNGKKLITVQRLGEVLYPNNPKNIYTTYRRNQDYLDKYVIVDRLSTESTISRPMMFVDLKGVIAFLRFARTPIADKFMDWAIEHLAELITTGVTTIAPIQQNNMITELSVLKQMVEYLEKQEMRLRMLEEKDQEQEQRILSLEEKTKDSPINARQQHVIKTLIHRIAFLKALKEGKEKAEQKHYAETYSRFKEIFAIAKYDHLPQRNYQDAIGFLNRWIDKLKEELEED